mmetsp:Transcript_17597/g.52877  ORF Transcript_17597/g.52877 Transcript_17597/m.52877 type:complete len:382 (-) Transcript_17597:521-1666(-)
MPGKKKLLVIGGGTGGAILAVDAAKKGMDVTLVDRKDFANVMYANLRYAVQPKAVTGLNIPYSEIKGVTHKKATVAKMTKSSAELSTGEVIDFDFAVIATGSTNGGGVWAQPQGTTLAEREAEVKETSAKVAAAKNIVIVGGGPVGVELAGEILEYYVGKKITLVHSGERLLESPYNRDSVVGSATNAAAWLKQHGVDVKLNTRAEEGAGGVVRLTPKKGGEATTVQADLVVWAVGSKPNTEWLNATDFASALDGSGHIQVGPDLRVKGFKNVFAVGDVTDVKEEKLGFLTTMHAHATAANLAVLAAKGEDAKLAPWKPGGPFKGLFVTLGPKGGVGFMMCCTAPSCMVASMKSKDLFVSQFRQELGLNPVTQPTMPAASA